MPASEKNQLKEEDNSDPKDIDDLLVLIGTGKWNLIYYIGMSIEFFVMPCLYFATFLIPNTLHTCVFPSSLNESDVYFMQVYIHNDYVKNNCSYFYTDQDTGLNITEKCTNWKYDKDDSIESLTSEFDLVCDRAYLRPTFQMIYLFGLRFGALFTGHISDRFGRTKVITIITYATTISTIILTFLNNFTLLMSFRFICGLLAAGIFPIGFTLCMEITEPRLRSTIGCVIALPWALGMMWWGALAYLIRDWRWLQRVSVAPFAISMILLCFTYESPRWLAVKGNSKQALKCLKIAAKWNNNPLPSDEKLNQVLTSIKEGNEHAHDAEHEHNLVNRLQSFLGEAFKLFRTKEVRRRMLLSSFVFVVTSTVYLGLALNAANFKLNPYIYMVVGGMMEVPAYTVIIPIISKFGRIKPAAACYLICAVTVFGLAFVSHEITWLITSLAMIGRFANSAAFQIIFLLASEIFPTDIRMQATGTLIFILILGVGAPYITDILGAIYPKMPSIIFGILSLLAMVTVLFLPETLNKHLPETVAQLENETKAKKNKKNLVLVDGEAEKIKLST